MKRLHLFAIVLLLFVAACSTAPEPPEAVAPISPVIDTPAAEAVYRTPDDAQSEYDFVLALYDDGTARLETRLPDESPPFLELGMWETRDQMLLVVVTQTRRLDYDEPRPILFDVRGSSIVALDYDTLFYGEGGMQMSQVDVAAQPLLSETTWRLTRLEYAGELYQPAEGSTYTVTFAENGTLNARADCNRVTGLYSDLASFVTLSSLVATEAACEGGSFSDEYVAALRATRRYEVVAGTLVFTGDNELLAQFETM